MNIVPSFEIIPFSASDYLAVVSNCGRVGARGGAFFDVLHLHAARSAQADEILTLNDGHFAAFGPDLIARLRKPQ
jgi:hypothetical protein